MERESLMKTPSISRDRFASGFTLLELLAVMAIMGILLAAIVPLISGIMESTNITSGGQMVADEINQARQLASAKDTVVEVCFLQLTPQPAQPTGYNYLLLWSPATSSALSRVIKLPDGVCVSQDTNTFSTLFNSYAANGNMNLPAGPAKYVAFTINPTGLLGPIAKNGAEPNMTKLTIGVLPVREATTAALTALVHNYVLVQVNPITAATLIYRP